MTLPKKLQEKRDELCDLYKQECLDNWHSPGLYLKPDFNKGFEQACALLLPEINKLVEAMKFASAEDMWESDGEYVESFSYQYKEWYQDKLDETLQSWQEFLNGK